MAIEIDLDQLTEQGKENFHNWSEKGHFTDEKEQLKEEIMDCLEEDNTDEKEQLKEEIMDCLEEDNDEIIKFKPDIAFDDATKTAMAELRKIYGNGHRSRPSDSVPQHFIPDL